MIRNQIYLAWIFQQENDEYSQIEAQEGFKARFALLYVLGINWIPSLLFLLSWYTRTWP